MRLTIRMFGVELLHLEITSPDPEVFDPAEALSGGNLTAYPLDAGPTDHFMGFTSGLEDQ